MKTINIEFFTWGICSINVEVPDGYELPSSDPYEIWEDLYENYGDQIDTDIMDESFYGVPDFADFEVEQMGIDYISSMRIIDRDKKEILSQKFEKVLYCDWYRNRD